MRLRIGHLSTFYHTAIILMARQDTDDRLEGKTEWFLFGTGPAIMQAFKRGDLDLAYIGLPPAIIGMDQGIKVVCVAGGHVEGTVMAGKAQWTGYPDPVDLGAILRQFQGRKIGVPGAGSIHDVIVRDSVARHGLEREIEIVNFPWADLVTEAVVNDDVAAAFGTPALAVAISRFAGGKILYPAFRLWPNNPSYGIVVDAGYAAREPEIVERFLGLHEEATAFIRQRPAEAARMIADYVGVVDEGFVLDTLGVSPKYCAQLTEDYIASTMKFIPVLRKMGYIKSEVTRERIFTRDFIDRVHPEKDHYSDGIRMQ